VPVGHGDPAAARASAGRRPAVVIGVDIGGTFTDVVVVAGRRRHARKVLSTPGRYEEGVLEAVRMGLTDAGAAPGAVTAITHATTIGTNAVLQRNGATTALVTTAGFRDVLELRRMRSPEPYDLEWRKPAPLVPRYLRFEVEERLDSHGCVIRPLEFASVEAVIDGLRRLGPVTSVAICLLHSYRSSKHELEVADALAGAFPDLCLSLSSQVLPELGEYERTSTTVADAYIKPVVSDYLARLEDGLARLGVEAPLYVMQSNGGCLTADSARTQPYRTLESGPAGGVLAAVEVCKQSGYELGIAFDMGGTTTKASLIENGRPVYAPFYEIGAPLTVGSRMLRGGGYLIRGPAVDIAEVGTGGGSQLWIDAGGQLAVGPQSSGASPGPACYGLGGAVPTLTDADVLLGYVNPSQLAGGALRIDRDLARRALENLMPLLPVATPEEVAFQATVVATAGMARVVRAISVERGVDPRRCALITYGGAGPVHAAQLAAVMEVPEVVVPPVSGVLTAAGLVSAKIEREFVAAVWSELSGEGETSLVGVLGDLKDRAVAELGSQGWKLRDVRFEPSADLQYEGQAHHLNVPLQPARGAWVARLLGSFHRAHQRVYGYQQRSAAVQLINLRLRALVDVGTTSVHSKPSVERSPADGPQTTTRLCYFGAGWIPARVMPRSMLPLRWTDGPIVVDESDTSIVVPPGCRARRDRHGNVLVGVPTRRPGGTA